MTDAGVGGDALIFGADVTPPTDDPPTPSMEKNILGSHRVRRKVSERAASWVTPHLFRLGLEAVTYHLRLLDGFTLRLPYAHMDSSIKGTVHINGTSQLELNDAINTAYKAKVFL